MAERIRLEIPKPEEIRMPQAPEEPEVEKPLFFINSGSTILDLAIGGGWAGGRIFNIVGDRSSGKTLLAIESFANFKRQFPGALMRYAEAEGAFDDAYAQQLGFPTEVQRPDSLVNTVEEFYSDLSAFTEATKKSEMPSLYILDSLDALSSDAEIARKFGDTNTYGTEKAKKLSELFRKLIKPLSEAKVTLGIISQVRDDIGVTYGNGDTRSGGRALDFYCTQIVWLHHVGQMLRTIKGIKYPIGIDIKAKCKKNKVTNPFREAEMSILFGYGIDDHNSMAYWLSTHKLIPDSHVAKIKENVYDLREKGNRAELERIHSEYVRMCREQWAKIEEELRPKTSKY